MNILDRFMDRVAVVTGNNSNHNYGPPGSRFVIKSLKGGGGTIFRGIREVDSMSGNDIYALDFDIDPKQFSSTGGDSKMEKLAKWEETPDEFKNLSVIQIKDDETIYLSSALRTLLKAKEGSKIVLATETTKKGKRVVYIGKDDKEGDELNANGEIKTTANCRVLLREFQQNILFVDFSPVYNEDFPDLVFYKIGARTFEQFDYGDATKMKFNPGIPDYIERIKSKPSISKTVKSKEKNVFDVIGHYEDTQSIKFYSGSEVVKEEPTFNG